MRLPRQVRVMMLGWEYPPRFAGGLGKACRGFSQAMARQGAEVFFVLPSFPERIAEERLEVVGAQEVLLEQGWTPETLERARSATISATRVTATPAGVSAIHVDATLFPYGGSPQGEVPETIRRFLESQQVEQEVTTAGLEQYKPKSKPQTQTSNQSSKKIIGAGEIYGRNLWSEIERFTFSVRQLAETHDVDCVHAHDWMTFPAAFEFSRVTGAPVFLHVHATEYDRSGENVSNEVFRIEREGFRRAAHIFAVSRYTAGVIERLYGVSRKKISVLYNAPEDEVKELAASPDAPRSPQVIFLGRLTFQKGPDHFLRAAQLVCNADSNARFVFCGTGDMFDKLRKMAHDLGIEDRVHFAGFVDPSGVDQILKESKVLVMPSVSEPFGLVALEAIHCGIPVILSKQSGVREVLHRALQVDFWDHEKLADQILAALRLRDLSRQLVNDGMEQVQQLSWDKSARKALETYRTILGTTYAQSVISSRWGAHGH